MIIVRCIFTSVKVIGVQNTVDLITPVHIRRISSRRKYMWIVHTMVSNTSILWLLYEIYVRICKYVYGNVFNYHVHVYSKSGSTTRNLNVILCHL